MNRVIRAGMNFGATSAVITTLGLMVGLYYGTQSTLAVIGGIVTIAVADALSDALGMHLTQEGEAKREKEVWTATISTFAAKLVVALTFLAPVLLLPLETAMAVCVAWGLILISGLSYFIAANEGKQPMKVIAEHLAIAIAVIVITYFLGIWVHAAFA